MLVGTITGGALLLYLGFIWLMRVSCVILRGVGIGLLVQVRVLRGRRR